jgi:hypothetical protein
MSNFSPLRLTTLISAVAATVAIIFSIVIDSATHNDLIPASIGRALWAVAILTWLGYINTSQHDTILKRLHHLDTRMNELDNNISDYGDRRETDGQLAGMRRAGETIHPQRPHLVQ